MAYSTDLTDAQWNAPRGLFSPRGRPGRRARISARRKVNAILWLARTGAPWRYRPRAYGPWGAIWQQFRRQLEYKTGWYGTELVVADRWFASSKTCSDCGVRNGEPKRGQATWVCPSCGAKHDRDLNAATNLARWPTLQLEAAA